MEHRGHRVSVQADTRAILQVPLTSLAISGASVVFADRHRLRETTSGLRASRLLLIAGILVTPFMIMGYLGLTVFLCVPPARRPAMDVPSPVQTFTPPPG